MLKNYHRLEKDACLMHQPLTRLKRTMTYSVEMGYGPIDWDKIFDSHVNQRVELVIFNNYTDKPEYKVHKRTYEGYRINGLDFVDDQEVFGGTFEECRSYINQPAERFIEDLTV